MKYILFWIFFISGCTLLNDPKFSHTCTGQCRQQLKYCHYANGFEARFCDDEYRKCIKNCK